MLLFTILVLVFSGCSGVDRNNFKTCDQSSFCKRQRAVPENASPYLVLLDSVSQSPKSGVVMEVSNEKNQASFILQLSPLKEGMLRVLMDEKNPIYPRFKEPYAVLERDLVVDEFTASKTAESIIIKWGNCRAELQAKPILLSVFRDDQLILTLNGRGLMKYEHYRTKPQISENAHEHNESENEAVAEEVEQDPADKVQGENVPQEGDEEDQEGLWEETFKGHHDSKPRGPSSIGVDISFIGVKNVYGIPEHADTFSLKETTGTDPYRLYNLDVFEHELYNPMALYASIPFMIGHSAKNSAGVFWHNAAETWVDIKKLPASDVVSSIAGFFSSEQRSKQVQVSSHWMSEAGIIDLFIMTGPSPMDVFRQYAIVTGPTNLPPMFSLAYHQCRWNYNDEQDVKTVHENFDKHNIPMDVMWLDIEHTDGKRYFTWDPRKFPNPEEMTNALSAKGRKLVTIIDPHIKRDDNYPVYKEHHDLDHFIKTKEGNEFDGWCWPGSSSYLDMTNSAARELFSQRFALDKYKGSTLDTFTWNDMNEPSVFSGPEVTMNKDSIHPGLNVEHREVHNVVGMLFHASTYDGLLRRSDNKLRPFVLTRAAYAGSQRSTAIWTGDNKADWEYLKISVPMLLSLSVSGLSHAGADIGGFFGNPEPELLVRWYQAAAYTPFFRAHAHLDSQRREPWLLDPSGLGRVRRAIHDHYRILPFFYTLFQENSRTGAPVMRPLWAHYPTDENTFSLENQYLLGDALLVAPVLEASQSSVSVYFPAGLWYQTHDNSLVSGPTTQNIAVTPDIIPVYQRGGSIVPRKERQRRSSVLMKDDPYTIIVAVDATNKAQGRLYIDDEATFNYKQGEFLDMMLEFDSGRFTCRQLHTNSSFTTKSWLERLVIVGLTKTPNSIYLQTEGKKIQLEGGLVNGSADKANRLIIRKPGVNMGQSFTIILE